MSKREVRRVQVTGGSTFIVSLPKWWVEDLKLKRGDLLDILPQPDHSLVILPRGGSDGEGRRSASIEATPTEDVEGIVRLLIARYLAGYDVISIQLGGHVPDLGYRIKDAIRRKLVGVEVMESSADRIVVQSLLGHAEFPLKAAISRMHVLSSLMHRDAMRALKEVDLSLADDVEQRDDDVDRLYFFVVRQLKSAVVDRSLIKELGLSGPKDCLGYRIVAKSLERIADHATNIAQAARLLSAPMRAGLMESIEEAGSVAMDVCEYAMRALSGLDVELAQRSISLAQEVGAFEKTITRKILESGATAQSMMGLRLALESIRRTADYGADISEIAINLSV
ncbi:MAG: phosphate uptake regulator PhoU [Candidatus Bathyarchaeia archaeon]